MRLWLSIPFVCACLLGCAPFVHAQEPPDSTWEAPEFAEPEKPLGADPHLDSIVRPWLGTKHRMGKQTKDAIDCSGFVQVILQDYLAYKTARSSAKNYLQGDSIGMENLLPGDVVFFAKRKRIYHSGVWIGNGHFAHSSSSHGVEVTELFADPYWRSHYAGARRYVINPAFTIEAVAQMHLKPAADSLPPFSADN